MISEQFMHPDFYHSLGKDYSRGTLRTKDKALDDLTEVNVPSQHQAAIFVSQFHSEFSFLPFQVTHIYLESMRVILSSLLNDPSIIRFYWFTQ